MYVVHCSLIPRPSPALQCCTLKSFLLCNTAKLGIGPRDKASCTLVISGQLSVSVPWGEKPIKLEGVPVSMCAVLCVTDFMIPVGHGISGLCFNYEDHGYCREVGVSTVICKPISPYPSSGLLFRQWECISIIIFNP